MAGGNGREQWNSRLGLEVPSALSLGILAETLIIDEINRGPHRFMWAKPWSFLIRFIIPAAITYIFITGIL